MTDLLAAAEIAEAAALDLANEHDYDPHDAARPGLDDLDSALYAVTNALSVLREVKEQLESMIGEVMGTKRVTVNGRTLERHVKTDRKQWNPDLWKAWQDTVLVDSETGEITPETPLEKHRVLFNDGVPRLTPLRDRGIDPEDWCVSERRPGYTIKVV